MVCSYKLKELKNRVGNNGNSDKLL